MDFPVELPDKFQALAEELKIDPEDISEAFTRGTGSGGQKINKTSICVELTHVPTGITVRVQKHRQQSANRISAYKLLISKIETKVKGKKSEKAKKLFKLRKQKKRRSKRAKQKMLDGKHRQSDIKETRKKIV